MRFLLSYTAHQSSGLGAWNRDTEHMQKAFHFGGMTARSGVTSALIVQAGWTGVEDIFSGKDNFFQAYNPHADPAGLTEKLGERYEISRTNIKKWPVGSPIQLMDGTHLTQRVDNVRGTPKNPMTRDEIVAKARDLIAPILGTAQCANLIERVLNLDRVKDIRELRPLLQRA
jgi:2-methylcitrate dehydratase PrpD